jgi:chorismate synthase
MRVAAGAIAKKVLSTLFDVRVRGCLTQLGPIECAIKDWDQVNSNPFFSADPEQLDALDQFMRDLRRDEDSIGAKLTVVAEGLPPGWGEPVFDRLDADIAHALMSINAVKGVEIGEGFSLPSPNDIEDEPWRERDSSFDDNDMQAEIGDYAIFLRKAAVEVKFDNELFLIVPYAALLLLIREND